MLEKKLDQDQMQRDGLRAVRQLVPGTLVPERFLFP